jgi:hypothetical protein
VNDQSGRSQVIHVNRLKRAYNDELWRPNVKPRARAKSRKIQRRVSEEEEAELQIRSYPVRNAEGVTDGPGSKALPDTHSNTPQSAQASPEISVSENRDPTYYPPSTTQT